MPLKEATGTGDLAMRKKIKEEYKNSSGRKSNTNTYPSFFLNPWLIFDINLRERELTALFGYYSLFWSTLTIQSSTRKHLTRKRGKKRRRRTGRVEKGCTFIAHKAVMITVFILMISKEGVDGRRPQASRFPLICIHVVFLHETL